MDGWMDGWIEERAVFYNIYIPRRVATYRSTVESSLAPYLEFVPTHQLNRRTRNRLTARTRAPLSPSLASTRTDRDLYNSI